ncbi:MAG: hypothetical protein NTY19_19025 [Planctomycetota bacterium]|nr:hypothetical protein [Planctomycetota bacterium]
MTGRPYGPQGTSIGPDDVGFAKQSLRDLNYALRQFAKTIAIHEGTLEAVKALIRDCLRLLKKGAASPLDSRQDDDAGHQELCDNLQRLKDRIIETVEVADGDGANHVAWIELGMRISDGTWVPPRQRSIRKCFKLGNRELELNVENTEGWIWQWCDPDELRQLFSETGTSEEELFPCTEDTAPTRRLLSYNFDEYQPWYRTEAGLVNAVQLLPPAVVSSSSHEAGSADHSPESVEDRTESAWPVVEIQTKPFALRLRVDIDMRLAFLDEELHRLDSEEAACYVAALVDAMGDWQGASDLADRYACLDGVRPNRVKTAIPKPIRDLIETQDAKGSRIPISNLLPASLVSQLWPDHA